MYQGVMNGRTGISYSTLSMRRMATMCLLTVFIGFNYVRIAVVVLDRSRRPVRKVWLAQYVAWIRSILVDQLVRIVFANNSGIGHATLLRLRGDRRTETRMRRSLWRWPRLRVGTVARVWLRPRWPRMALGLT